MKTQSLEMPLNSAEPTIMHIDLNSCFATIEQQANRNLRGRPIAVAAYLSPRGCILAPSIEAKQYGVKTGMMVQEGKALCPDLIVLPSDPPKYRDAHQRLKHLFTSYTNLVAPKSIDEAVIDFTGSQAIKQKTMVEIGYEIKQRVYQELGEWMKINVGISTNRFWAKTAASLHKPDGLDVITKDNILDVYRQLELTDLTGINIRYERRLNAAGIYTPLEFVGASIQKLKLEVFHSIVGYYWYVRLRGWEIDAVEFKRRSIGHTYALGKKTNNIDELSKLLMKLCEKVGRRMRRFDYCAEGIHVSCHYQDGGHWHKGMKVGLRLYTTQEIYRWAMKLLKEQGSHRVVTNLFITVYELRPYEPEQLSIFDGNKQDKRALSKALDAINNRYGEMTIVPAMMAGMGDVILDRIAFGSIKDTLDLYDDLDS